MNLAFPQNLKFKKYCKRFLYGRKIVVEHSQNYRPFMGTLCSLIAKESGVLTKQQIKTSLDIIRKSMKGRSIQKRAIACSLFLRAPRTIKPLGARMGRGRGKFHSWILFVRPGRVLFQIQGFSKTFRIIKILQNVQYKLPILTHIVTRNPIFKHG